jgi:hypothetical protein
MLYIYIMSEYICKSCDYSTNSQTNFERHKKSQKHNNKTVYNCKYCKNQFKNKQSKWNHENYTCKMNYNKKKYGSKDKLLDAMIEQLNKKDIFIMEQLKDNKQERKEYLDIIKENNKTANKSMSTIAYVIKHYKNAPPIKKLKDKDAIKMLEYSGSMKCSTEEAMIYKFRSGLLHKYMGDLIIDAYQASDNPEKQSMWSSDVARLSFVKVQEMSKDINEWITDKSGVKIMELIIDPLLNNANKLLKEYIVECGIVNNRHIESNDSDNFIQNNSSDSESDESESDESECSNNKISKLIYNMQTAQDIRIMINNKKLHKEVLNYICPYFKINIKK